MTSTAKKRSIEEPGDLHGLLGQVVARRFRVLGLRHSGPRSTVYEAEPPGVGRCRRALKVLGLPEAREPEALERLHGQVDRVRGLEHPHLEQVYELGTLPDGAPYLVTEYLPLDSLDDALAHGGRQPAARAMQVVAAAAEGLAALHELGVVHGDVRPEHVLVSPARDGFARVVLADAGIAARLESRIPASVRGPLAYLSPQRVRGGRATAADDVYALGVLAYLLMTGQLPFPQDDERARGVSADPVERVRWLHEHALPIRPAEVVSKPTFGAQVEAVIGRALAKDPAHRYADAASLLTALDRAQAFEGGADLAGLFHGQTPAPRAPTPPPEDPFTPAPEAFEAPPLPRPQLSAPPTTPVWMWAIAGIAIGGLLALIL